MMNREELKNELNKMFCNYTQESDDMATFYEVALGYIGENSDLDLDYIEDFEEAIEIVEEVIAGK